MYFDRAYCYDKKDLYCKEFANDKWYNEDN